MKILHSIIVMYLLSCTSVAFALNDNDVDTNDADSLESSQPKNQDKHNSYKPDIAGDGINNAFQVEDPSDIGRSGSVPEHAPEPAPVEGGAGHKAR
ncbi:MAG: hypothetical protein ACN4GM_06205 [Gammaproteobacteria bacterium]